MLKKIMLALALLTGLTGAAGTLLTPTPAHAVIGPDI